MHNRIEPKPHRFYYNVFMFYIDLDEIDNITKKLWLVSKNKFNVFNFRDKDHIQLPSEKPDTSKNVKQHLCEYLKQNGVELKTGKIMLLTNLCTFGYQFNPVSFYFCFDEQNRPVCCVPEVGNTFLEIKPYLLDSTTLSGNKFRKKIKKLFYVSPFSDMDTEFDFNIEIPSDKLNIRIDDYKNEKRIFISTLNGSQKELSNLNLFWYSFRFPFITLQVIGFIHWQALKLWLKKIPYHKKNDNKELQQNIFRPYNDHTNDE
ncbi:MAG: DUF1365 domain-containing protein [Bacteroidia bacterium]|nr:DUF1365 domain-containing protein [Bacteroidia bacterium]